MHTFIAYSILQSVFRSYADAIIFHCNSFDHFFVCNYCCKLFVKEDFLHSFSSDALCILCCALCWYYMYRVLSHICSNKIKNETRFLITPNNVLHIHFLSEFTIIIFIMFFWISQLCCVALIYKIDLDIYGWLQGYSP